MAEVRATTKLDSTGFNAGTAQMKGSIKQLGTSLQALKGVMIGVFGFTAIKGFIKSAIRAQSVIEDLTVQFGVLFKNVDLAVKRMEELKKFSATTPFQLADIADASQTLEVFSEGLLGDVNSLRLFGDAAAATGNKDLKDMSFWVGRLFAALQSGRPFIDSANALSRLKVLGPTTLKTMIDMEAAGASGAQVWDVFTKSLKQFEGGMVELSKTTSGKASTMADNWDLAMAKIGKSFEGFTKDAIQGWTDIAVGFGNMAEKLRLGGRQLGRNIFREVHGRKGMGDETLAQEDLNKKLEQEKRAKEAEAQREAEAHKILAKKKAEFEEKTRHDASVKREKQIAKDQAKWLKAQQDKRKKQDADAKKKAKDEEAFNKSVEKAKDRLAKMDVGRVKVDADRLGKIGGSVGGAVSPEMSIAQRNMELNRKRNELLESLSPEITKAIENSGGLG
jgi:hypothetical protein